MQRISREFFDRLTLEASLQRLDIIELEERLEFSPLLVESGLQDNAAIVPQACCLCKTPDDYNFPVPSWPYPGGDGSTGPTDGGAGR